MLEPALKSMRSKTFAPEVPDLDWDGAVNVRMLMTRHCKIVDVFGKLALKFACNVEVVGVNLLFNTTCTFPSTLYINMDMPPCRIQQTCSCPPLAITTFFQLGMHYGSESRELGLNFDSLPKPG